MGSKTRLLLIYSLGGLLLLTAITGATALISFQRVRRQEDALRAQFLEKTRRLEQIRGDIYLSGTLARDYFVEADDAEGAVLLTRLRRLQEATQGAPNANLRGEILAYWKLLDLMEGMSKTRRTAGLDAYFRRQLAQRRETMLQISEDIGAALAAEWKSGEQSLVDIDSRFRSVLAVELALVFAMGVPLSILAVNRLVRLEQESRALSAQLVRAQEEERRAISRELHDEVGQALNGLLLDIGTTSGIVDSGEARSRLQAIAALAERTVDAVRRIALSLRPSMLDDLGLVPALEWQAREAARRMGVNVEVNAVEEAGDLPDSYRTCIYRVAQEALQNCARHAAATRVHVGLEKDRARVLLCVEDNGRGFMASRTRGLGLLGMEERVAQLGGRFRVRSSPGGGTSVLAELPL